MIRVQIHDPIEPIRLGNALKGATATTDNYPVMSDSGSVWSEGGGGEDDQFCFNYQVSFVPMRNLAVKTEKMFNPFGYGVIEFSTDSFETERAMVLKIHGALIDLGVKYSLTFDSSSWEVEE